MTSDNARQQILKKIEQALKQSVPVPFPELPAENPAVFNSNAEDPAIVFAEQFTQLQGQFAFCINMQEVCEQLLLLAQKKGWRKWVCRNAAIRQQLEKHGWNLGWHDTLHDCQVSITACEALVARTGTIVLSSAVSDGRTTSVYAPVHICLATTGQLVNDIGDAIENIQNKYGGQLPSLLSFASGPSRTADIEKTLVTGVHGPKEVFCFLLEA
jgi:L-lactate dehydrogenase complex protein LldG